MSTIDSQTTARLFLAAPLTKELKIQTIKYIDQLKPFIQTKRWSPPENLHLTLRFLGNTPLDKIPDLIQNLSLAVQDLRKLTIQAKHITLFPTYKPHTVAIIFSLTKELTKLVHRLEQCMFDSGFETEKHAFIPHVTLCRFSEQSKIDQFPIPINATLLINKIILFSSKQTQIGSTYKPIGKLYLNP